MCHDTMIEGQPGLKSWLKKRFIGLVYGLAAEVVCISPKTAKEFDANYPSLANKRVTIYNPVNRKFLNSPSLDDQVRGEYSAVHLVYVGLRDGNKNFVHFEEILRVKPDVVFYVVGAKFSLPERRRYQKWIESGNLVELGSLTDDEYIDALKRAHGLYLPSADEGFGLPIIEALSIRVPVLVVKQSLVNWIVKDGFVLWDGTRECIDELVELSGKAKRGDFDETWRRALEVFRPECAARKYLSLIDRG